MMKKFIAMLLCVILCFALLPTWALAAETEETTEVQADEAGLADPDPEQEPGSQGTDGNPEVAGDVETDGENLSENTENGAIAGETDITEPSENPEDEEPAEQEEQPVTVVFYVTPEEAELRVWPAENAEAEETTEQAAEEDTTELPEPIEPEEPVKLPEPIAPEENSTYLLMPGEYLYTVEADGYAALDRVSLTVEASDEVLEVTIVLEKEVEAKPLSTFADQNVIVIEEDVVVDEDFTLPADGMLLVQSGSLVVKEGILFRNNGYISIEGGELIVEQNGSLENDLFILVNQQGTLKVEGSYEQAEAAALIWDNAEDGAVVEGIENSMIDKIVFAADASALNTFLSRDGFRTLTVQVSDAKLVNAVDSIPDGVIICQR